ncbi:MAG: methyltransferase [Bacteroidota bacterium]
MKPFKFKQFTIHQDRSAMKVGTDGVLLGAVASLKNHPNSILDIGAGTGLIALMLAQRSSAETIDAIELDESAYEQCVENFEASPWANRLFCYHASFQEFYREMEEHYEVIVSNPPFFSENVSSRSSSRDQARQNNALPFEHLFEGVEKLLAKTGIFAVIIPKTQEKRVLELAKQMRLFPFEILRIKGNPNVPFKRCILQFSYMETPISEKELIIELERHEFTNAYINLTKDFHPHL